MTWVGTSLCRVHAAVAMRTAQGNECGARGGVPNWVWTERVLLLGGCVPRVSLHCEFEREMGLGLGTRIGLGILGA